MIQLVILSIDTGNTTGLRAVKSINSPRDGLTPRCKKWIFLWRILDPRTPWPPFSSRLTLVRRAIREPLIMHIGYHSETRPIPYQALPQHQSGLHSVFSTPTAGTFYRNDTLLLWCSYSIVSQQQSAAAMERIQIYLVALEKTGIMKLRWLERATSPPLHCIYATCDHLVRSIDQAMRTPTEAPDSI